MSPVNVHDSDLAGPLQPPARTCPAASKGSASRPSGTIPAPATLDSTGQSVNMVRLLFCGYYFGHWSYARCDARK